ncbi:hypothetical protein ACFL11_01275 [Patescibacteria group bacterium]
MIGEQDPIVMASAVFDEALERCNREVTDYGARDPRPILLIMFLPLLFCVFLTFVSGLSFYLLLALPAFIIGVIATIVISAVLDAVPPTGYQNLVEGCLRTRQYILGQFVSLRRRVRITSEDSLELDNTLRQLEKGMRACGSFAKCRHRYWCNRHRRHHYYSCAEILRLTSEETNTIRRAFDMLLQQKNNSV